MKVKITWPVPTAPQWTIFLPKLSSNSFASAKLPSGPPTMNVRTPSLAALTPRRDQRH